MDLEIDDKHEVKYVGRSPEQLFEEEKGKLLKVPIQRWDMVRWCKAKVGMDWKVQVECAFYSVPWQYVGEEMNICVNSHNVIIYRDHKEVTRHRKALYRWERVIKDEHAPPNQEEYLKTTSAGVRHWANMLGENIFAMVEKILGQKGVDGLKAARGICGLTKKFEQERVERACQRALYYNLIGYNNVKNILIRELDKIPLEQENPQSLQLNMFKKEQFRYARNGQYYNS